MSYLPELRASLVKAAHRQRAMAAKDREQRGRSGDGRRRARGSGEVTVTVDDADGGVHRLTTLSAGMVFGELAAVGQFTRSADVRANGPVEVRVLSAKAFADLGRTRPELQAALLQNLLRGAYETVERTTREVATLRRAL
jgi:CRP-like cAMP-binding protein